MVRPTFVEIDLDAIRHNVRALDELIGSSLLCAVVKADGYGHGDVPVANAAIEAGATWVAVALVEEAIRLREAGVSAPILLLSQPAADSVDDINRWDLTPTVYSTEFLEALSTSGFEGAPHIKIDTGMHRVGANPDALGGLLDAIDAKRGLEVGAVWSHFSAADTDPVFTRQQIERFDSAVKGHDIPMLHLANTAGAVLYPEARRDLSRIGLGLYGLHPNSETADVVSLRPAMRLLTHVSHVQYLRAGDRPSYGRIRELREDATVVTAPVGYADGFARGLSDDGSVIIGGKRFRLAGAVTMDQIMVDVGHEDVTVGDEVVLLGSQSGETIEADEWAKRLNTISYEVVCSIGPRVPRRYLT